jgi:hypothetical protein
VRRRDTNPDGHRAGCCRQVCPGADNIPSPDQFHAEVDAHTNPDSDGITNTDTNHHCLTLADTNADWYVYTLSDANAHSLPHPVSRSRFDAESGFGYCCAPAVQW